MRHAVRRVLSLEETLCPPPVEEVVEHEQKKHPHANPLVYGTAHQLKGHEQEQQHGHGGVHGEFYNGFRLHASSLL